MKRLLIGVLCITILAMLVTGCESIVTPKTHEIHYEVTGSAQTVSLTYQNEDGGTSQESDVSVPWYYTFDAETGDYVYVSAQNMGETGTVTVTIYKDGEELKTSTSSGAYVIAMASDML